MQGGGYSEGPPRLGPVEAARPFFANRFGGHDHRPDGRLIGQRSTGADDEDSFGPEDGELLQSQDCRRGPEGRAGQRPRLGRISGPAEMEELHPAVAHPFGKALQVSGRPVVGEGRRDEGDRPRDRGVAGATGRLDDGFIGHGSFHLVVKLSRPPARP